MDKRKEMKKEDKKEDKKEIPMGHMSLYEYAKMESGLTDHREIVRYMNRHYGFG